jgi:hypothetical protein
LTASVYGLTAFPLALAAVNRTGRMCPEPAAALFALGRRVYRPYRFRMEDRPSSSSAAPSQSKLEPSVVNIEEALIKRVKRFAGA